MVQKITVTRNKLGLEDLLFGTGTTSQVRGGVATTVTKINAANLPFDETQNLAQALDGINAAADLIESYGSTLNAIAANIDHLLTIEQVEIIGNDGNAATLEGQTLAQVRAGINASQLEGQTLAQVRSGINASQLGGQTLSQVRSGINASQLGGQTLSQVKEGGNAATLQGSDLAAVRSGINASQLGGQTLSQVKEGGNAATLQGSDLSAVISAATVGDATTSAKGKVELADATEAKGGTATGVVVTPANIAQHPLVPVAWADVTVNDSSVVINDGFGIVSGSISSTNLPLSFTLSSGIASGIAEFVITSSASISTLQQNGLNFVSLTAYGPNPAVVVSPKSLRAGISGSSTVNFGSLMSGYSFSGSGFLFRGILVVYGVRS